MSDFSIREMDSTKAFDGIASVYVKGRPTYAEKFVVHRRKWGTVLLLL